MAPSKKRLKSPRKRIQELLNAKRTPMCWELGEPPFKPHMLVCIDMASLAVMGDDLLRDPPSPQDLLSLLVVSMEKPGMATGAPILPEATRLDDSAAVELIGNELEHLGLKVVLVKRLSALPKFKRIIEREWFSQQVGYSGSEN